MASTVYTDNVGPQLVAAWLNDVNTAVYSVGANYGTWTPSVGGSATYITQIGRYVKVGRLVFIVGYFNINAIGTGSQSAVTGLPFTGAGVANLYFGTDIASYTGLATAVVSLYGQLQFDGSGIAFTGNTVASTSSSGTSIIFTSGSTIGFSGCYISLT
jgi:hypothetical protein